MSAARARKMNPNSVSPHRDEESHEGVEMINPILNNSRASGPSKAFLESMRRAKESEAWIDTRISSSHPNINQRSRIGVKTKLAIIGFLMLGLGLFTAGGVIYWSGDYGEDQMKTGLDLLVCSAIPLLPGIYGTVKWAGQSNGWEGYSSLGFSYD
jgi:hypothetical protein